MPEYASSSSVGASAADYYSTFSEPYQQELEENDNNISSLSNNTTSNNNNNTSSISDNLFQAYKIPGLNYSNLSLKPQGYSSNDSTTTSNNNSQYNNLSNLYKSMTATSTPTRGVFKIVGRVRPLNKSNSLQNEGNKIMEIGEDRKTALIGKYLNKANMTSATSFQFTFDRIFDEFANQSLFYSSCAHPLFKSFVGGTNANIITYGQTRSGKSYALEGLGDEERRGLIPRFVEDVFKFIYTYGQGQGVYNAKFTLSISYVQIYNDIITDLLSSNNTKGLKVADEKTKTVIMGMKKHTLKEPKEIFTVLKYAKQNRSVTTGMKPPDLHTRSHTILTLYLDQSWPQLISASSSSLDIQTHSISSKITFVELAGSEKAREFSQVVNSTPNVNEEGSKIAKTFSALAAVASSLGKLFNSSPISSISLNTSTLSNQSNNTSSVSQSKYHVPYRDSKLTHVLRETMKEDTMNLFITCLYPLPDNYTEILSSAKYSSRIRQCVNSSNSYTTSNENTSVFATVQRFPSPLKHPISVTSSPNKRVSFNNSTNDENGDNVAEGQVNHPLNSSQRHNNSDETPFQHFPSQQFPNSPLNRLDRSDISDDDDILNSFKEESDKVKLESEELRKILNIESVTRKNFHKNIEHLEQQLGQADDDRKLLREKTMEMSERIRELSETNMKLSESCTISKVDFEKLQKQKTYLEEEMEKSRKYIVQLSRENTKLNEQVVNGKDDSSAVKNQLEVLTIENNELRLNQKDHEFKISMELKQKVESLKNEIQLKDDSFKKLSEQFKEMKTKNEQLTEELGVKQEVFNQTKQELEDLRLEVEGLTSTLDAKESEIDQVYEQMDQLPKLKNEIERLDGTIKKVSQENQHLQNILEENQSMTGDLKLTLAEERLEFQQKLKKLSKELEREKKEKENLQSEIVRLNKKYSSTSLTNENELYKRDETIQMLRNDLEEYKISAEKTINDLKNNIGHDLEEKTKMSSELHAISSRKLELEVDLKKLQSQLTLLKKENEEKFKQVKSLSDEVMILNLDKNRIDSDFKNQVNSLKEKIADQQKQSDLTIYQLVETNKSLEARVLSLKDTTNNRAVQLEEALIAKKTLEEQVSKLVQSCGIDAHSKLGLDKEIERRVENSMRLASLEKQTLQRKNEIDQLYLEMEQKELEIEKLKKDLHENRLESQSLRNTSEESEYTITTLKASLNQCTEDRRNLREENIRLLSTNDKKEDVIRKLKHDIEVARMEIESIKSEKEHLQSMLKKTINNTSGVHDDLSQTKFEMLELVRERDTFEMQFLSCDKKCKVLEDEITAKEMQISDLKYAIECAKRENNNPILEESVRKLTDENKNLSKQCSDLKHERETWLQEKKVLDAQYNHYKTLHNDSLKLIDDIKREFELKSRELSDCKDELEHLRCQIEEKSTLLQKVNQLNLDNESLLENKCDEIEYLKVCLEDVSLKARDYSDKCISLESTIERLEKHVQQALDESNTYRTGLEKKETENNELFMRFKMVEIDRDDLKKQLGISQKELGEIENSYLELRSSQEQVTLSLQASQEQITKSSEEKKMIEKQLQQVQEQIVEMTDQIQKDQDEREMFISRMIKFERTIQQLTREKQQIESKLEMESTQAIQKLSNFGEQQETTMKELEQTIEKLELENQSLKQTISDVSRQVITLEEEKRKLCRTIVDIESDLERIKKAYEKTIPTINNEEEEEKKIDTLSSSLEEEKNTDDSDDASSTNSSISTEEHDNYEQFGYTQINNDNFNDDETSNQDDDETTNQELTFDDFDADFEKALTFVLNQQENNSSSVPPPLNNKMATTGKKKIKITLGAQDPSQKIQYINIGQEKLEDDHWRESSSNINNNTNNNNNTDSIEERINQSDIVLDSEKVNSIKNIIKDIELNPPKDLKWFSEDDWLIKLKKIKDQE